jgi:hypothetical protein
MLIETTNFGPTIRLVPHSGVQFVEYAFNMDTVGRFSRRFIEREIEKSEWLNDKPTYRLIPAWNENDPSSGIEETTTASDREYTISERAAIEIFLDRWVPVPVLRVKAGTEAAEELDVGPTNWARVRITDVPGRSPDPSTHQVIFAFDTELLDRRPNKPYTAPSREDAANEHEFRFVFRFREIAWFLGASRPSTADTAAAFQQWVSAWLFELFKEYKQAQRPGRPLREADFPNALEPFARYLAFLEYLHKAVVPRSIRFIDIVSAHPTIKPVMVDLILDIGNSRTCGILIESHPNEDTADLNNSLVLQLRDLSRPENIYAEPFESHVELSQASFGRDNLSRFAGRSRAFFWPSAVRVGPEAARFRDMAQGTEAVSGLSSPKRYLCDIRTLNQEWRFPDRDYSQDGSPPLIERAIRRFLNSKGDVIEQLDFDRKRYGFIVRSDDRIGATRLTFSRSSFFTLMVAEIACQALNMINNAGVRAHRKTKDAPRKLRRIILTLPPAMPVQEQRLLRSRAEAAVKLVWQLLDWWDKSPPGVLMPEVHVAWDEASCVHLVYLYGEITQKLRTSVVDFLSLVGRERPFAEPEQIPAAAARPEPSVRIASIDVGGGTTDLMITTYYQEGNIAIKPVQNFREGFRIAGDDILKGIIERLILPGIEAGLADAGHKNARALLLERFGGDRANMAEQEKHLRRQFVVRVLEPIALRMLADAESVTAPETTRAVRSFAEFFFPGDGISDRGIPQERTLEFVQGPARTQGAGGFLLKNCRFITDFGVMRQVVVSVLDDVFSNLSEAVHEFDCDVVLLSGRASKIPGVVDLLVSKLAVPPDRVIPMHEYQVGTWYPFRDRDNRHIGDPKTTTAVGGMLCALAESQLTNFTLMTGRLGLRSTAKYLGELDMMGRLLDGKVYFSELDLDNRDLRREQRASFKYYAPMRLGYRQLPVERWIATPLYRLRVRTGLESSQPRLPIEITIEREIDGTTTNELPEELIKSESMKEEFKIGDAFDANGIDVRNKIEFMLDTLPSEQGYWIDTGILSVG